MQFRNLPIQRKLTTIVLGTSIVVLLLTCTAFLGYEYFSFRHSATRQLSTLGEVLATNSTAVLAFDNASDAAETLSALRAERHIVAAALYDKGGQLFARYPAAAADDFFPLAPGADGYRFSDGFLVGFTPVVQVQGSQRLGTLYLRSDLEAMYERLRLYAGVALVVIAVLSLFAYLLSRGLQRQISDPILFLAGTARAVSTQRDYSVRAHKLGDDEIGLLTEAFNHMLEQIQQQNLALQRSHEQLETRVQDRTADLEAANKDLEDFASSVSHDLRTPLRAIKGLAELLLKDPAAALTPEARHSVGLVHTGCREMEQLIDSIMAFSHLGYQQPAREQVDLARLGREVFRDLTAGQPERALVFDVKPMAPVKGDPVLLRQVVVNLLANALKFTRNATPAVIELGMEQAEGEGPPVYYVRDNGVGFNMEEIERLFVIFQRLSHGEEFEGSGVGLAMVRRIIERHGGQVWAESDPADGGATFFFTLPG